MKSRKTIILFGALAFIAVLFSGCVVGPKYTSQNPELPDQFDETAIQTDTVSFEAWWRQFNDPLLAKLIEKTL